MPSHSWRRRRSGAPETSLVRVWASAARELYQDTAWVGQAHMALLVLSRMGHREALALVAKVSGADRLPDAVVEDILAKADGVPLFIEELTQSVLESVQGARDTGEDAISIARARSTVPTTLQDSLMARLDRLQSGRKLAQAGAAIGREFSVARVCLVHLLCDTEENALARKHAARGDVIIERLGAWSFQANNLSFLARSYRGDGEGAVGHNHLWFYRDAIEAMPEAGEWERVERYADALADYTRAEPLPWSEFWIARGRALAAFGRGRRDDATIRTLGTLREEAERVGLRTGLPAIDAALS